MDKIIIVKIIKISFKKFKKSVFFIEIIYFNSYIALKLHCVYLKFMSIKINYSNKFTSKSSTNLVLFVDEKFDIAGLKKIISNPEFSYITDLLKTSDLKKELLIFEVNSKKKIFLVSIKKDIKISDIENLGAKFHSYIEHDDGKEYSINSDTINNL